MKKVALNKLKFVLVFHIFLYLVFNVNAQNTGRFQKTIMINNEERVLEYAVPIHYNESTNHSLLVALHGCTGIPGTAGTFRNSFAFLTAHYNMIVVCPNAIASMVMDDDIIIASVEDALENYNVDSNQVYITGFSCNGHVSIKNTTNKLYNWNGIIPYNAGFNLGYLSTGVLDFEHNIPTCICIGSVDPSFELTNRYKDSLAYYGTPHYYNEMPGIGHTIYFPEFESEIMECINWFEDSIVNVNSIEIDNNLIQITAFENTIEINANKDGEFNLYDLLGKRIYNRKISMNNSLKLNFQSGIYLWSFNTSDAHIQRGKIMCKK
jgi:predicted esterase